jgi:hypothetical protein
MRHDLALGLLDRLAADVGDHRLVEIHHDFAEPRGPSAPSRVAELAFLPRPELTTPAFFGGASCSSDKIRTPLRVHYGPVSVRLPFS